MTGDRNSAAEPGDGEGSSMSSRLGWAIGLGVAMTAVAARQRLRQGAATVARVTADTLETSGELVERSVRGASRVALLPADATLALARDRVLAGLPEAADTKWRVTQLLFRALVVEQVARGDAAGIDLDDTGAVYARASHPEGNWDQLTLRETLRRVTHALDLDGTISRSGDTIEVVTTACPLIDGAVAEQHPAVCEAVCGESASLLHGICSTAGGTLESPERMGLGASRCLRRVTLAS